MQTSSQGAPLLNLISAGKKLIVFSIILGLPNLAAPFKFSNQASTLQLSGPSAKIIMSTPINNFNGTLSISAKTTNSIVATSTDTLLTFADGVYQANGSAKIYVNATFDPINTNAITLGPEQSINVDTGAIIESVLAYGNASSISGQPWFNAPITLQDENTSLILNLQSKLNQNIITNGGTIILANDLALQDEVFLLGPGTINLAGNTVILPATTQASDWSSDLIFSQEGSVILNGFTKLTGSWTFAGPSKASTLNGYSSILDLSEQGTLVVDSNHTLYLNDLHIKGLGAGHGNLVINPGGTLYLSNVTLELAGSYESAYGNIIVAGSNCTLISPNYYKFTLSGAAALTVDGVAMLYDPLGTAPLHPRPVQGTINYCNGGTIRPSYSLDGGGSATFFETNNLMMENHILAANAKLIFINENPLVPKTINVDGQGFYIQFNYANGQFMIIEPNLTVIFKSTLFKDFDPLLIDFQGTGTVKSQIFFDDEVVVGLGNDIFTPEMPFTFIGEGLLRGNGTTLTLDRADMLTSQGIGKNLMVKNLKLVLWDAVAMGCLNNEASITLQDTTIVMTSTGANFNFGNLNISGNVAITGANPTSPTSSAVFNFASGGKITVEPASSLLFESKTMLNYIPDVSSDAPGSPTIKRHLKLADPSATLSLNNAILNVGEMGLALDYGRLLINGQTTLRTATGPGAEVEFGTALFVELASGSLLDVDGVLQYNQTSYFL